MKILFFASVALLCSCGSAFSDFADLSSHLKLWEKFSQNLKVCNISHLTDNELNEIMSGSHPEIAVEFLAQKSLPISLFLKGDLVCLNDEENFRAVEIKQTFFVRCVEKELIFSTNLIDWKPFSEFITGNVSVSLSIQEGKASVVVGAVTNYRS